MTPQLKRYRRIARQNRAAGLTAHGTARKRRAALTPDERKRYNTAKFRLRTERLYEQGLTTRGTKRKRWQIHGHIIGEFSARVGKAVAAADRMKAEINARTLTTK